MPNKFLLVASDIHSSDESLEKLAKIASRQNCMGFLYAGDLDTDNYFISTQLQNRSFLFLPVLGNCDSPYSYIDCSIPQVPRTRTVTFGKLKILIHHGHYETEETSANVIISGHTHVNYLSKQDNTVYLNPGSPSKPRGTSVPSYATITEKGDTYLFEIKDFYTDSALQSLEFTV